MELWSLFLLPPASIPNFTFAGSHFSPWQLSWWEGQLYGNIYLQLLCLLPLKSQVWDITGGNDGNALPCSRTAFSFLTEIIGSHCRNYCCCILYVWFTCAKLQKKTFIRSHAYLLCQRNQALPFDGVLLQQN